MRSLNRFVPVARPNRTRLDTRAVVMTLVMLPVLAPTPSLTAQSVCPITFAPPRGEERGIYVMDREGSNPTRLTSSRWDLSPSWSPDRQRIAFMSIREGDMEELRKYGLAMHWMIYIMDADGTNVKRLTNTPAVALPPLWSPDGKKIAFQSSFEDERNHNSEGAVSTALYVINADGTNLKRLTDARGLANFPSWSPDGKHLAYSFSASHRDEPHLYVVNIDGSVQGRLLDHPAYYPLWSHDGRSIAFSSRMRDSDQPGIYLVDPKGNKLRRLIEIDNPRGRLVAWSADGKRMLFFSAVGWQFHVMDVETGVQSGPAGSLQNLLDSFPCNFELQDVIGRRIFPER